MDSLQQHIDELRAKCDAIAEDGLSTPDGVFVKDVKQFWAYLDLQREIAQLEKQQELSRLKKTRDALQVETGDTWLFADMVRFIEFCKVNAAIIRLEEQLEAQAHAQP